MDGYLNYIKDLICNGDIVDNYSTLLDILYRIDFRWSVRNDDNRIGDAIELRYNYQADCGISNDDMEELLLIPCSIIEVICGLAIRMDDIMRDPFSGARIGHWFWELIDNLGMSDFTDGAFKKGAWSLEDVKEKMDILMDRTYDELGHGGLFPRNVCYKDQRECELFEQMNGYLNEFYC
jgi:hypothetical protein